MTWLLILLILFIGPWVASSARRDLRDLIQWLRRRYDFGKCKRRSQTISLAEWLRWQWHYWRFRWREWQHRNDAE